MSFKKKILCIIIYNQSKDIDIRFHLIGAYAHGDQIEVRFIRTNEQLGPRPGHCVVETSLKDQNFRSFATRLASIK
jgi:hypothetical protein